MYWRGTPYRHAEPRSLPPFDKYGYLDPKWEDSLLHAVNAVVPEGASPATPDALVSWLSTAEDPDHKAHRETLLLRASQLRRVRAEWYRK